MRRAHLKEAYLVDGFLVAFLVGLSGGLANLLVDIPALWNYDWSNGLPSYRTRAGSLSLGRTRETENKRN